MDDSKSHDDDNKTVSNTVEITIQIVVSMNNDDDSTSENSKNINDDDDDTNHVSFSRSILAPTRGFYYKFETSGLVPPPPHRLPLPQPSRPPRALVHANDGARSA